LHRLRSTWLATRTARLNTIRGLLRELGIFIFIPVGAQHVVPCVRSLLVEPTTVPLLLHTTLAAACDETEVLETNMRAVERQLGALASEIADVTLLQTVPGVGVITATALVALVTDNRGFDSRSPTGLHRAPRIMAHRSDRRGGRPINSAGHQGRASDWLPARGFP